MTPYKNIIQKFKTKRIIVIGDIMVDQYILGRVSRISPEAPVPIVLQEEKPTYALGGAANVANNLRSLGAQVTLIGRVGQDPEGELLIEKLKERKINTQGVFLDKRVPTILKTRIIVKHQQVLRLDREREEHPLNGPLHKKLEDFFRKNLSDYDAVIISDYGKGMISSQLVTEICSLAFQKKKIVTVDPKVEHFGYYRGVTAITPNKSETENAIRNIKITQNVGNRLAVYSDQLKTDQDINTAGEALLKFLNLESLLITLGERGMRLFEKEKKPVHINTRAREVFDVTGAGDTVISVFTLGLTVGVPKHQAADISNYAAGIVVGKMGAVAVTPEELLTATKLHP